MSARKAVPSARSRAFVRSESPSKRSSPSIERLKDSPRAAGSPAPAQAAVWSRIACGQKAQGVSGGSHMPRAKKSSGAFVAATSEIAPPALLLKVGWLSEEPAMQEVVAVALVLRQAL